MMHPGQLLEGLMVSLLTLDPAMTKKRDRRANKRGAKHKSSAFDEDGWTKDTAGNRCFRRGRMLIHPGKARP